MMVFEWMFPLIECQKCKGNEFEAVEIAKVKGKDILDGKLKCKSCEEEVIIKEGVPILGVEPEEKKDDD